MLIGIYNKCKSYGNSLITWELEVPISTLIKSISSIWFSTRVTNTAHKYDVQEQSTTCAPLEGPVTLYMSNFKILNHSHISWFYKDKPGNTTRRNRNVDLKLSLGSKKSLEPQKDLNGNTPWGDPEGWFLPSCLLGELLEVDALVLQPNFFPELSTATESLWRRGTLMARELVALLPSPQGRVRPKLPALLSGTSQRWGSMRTATVLRYVYPHPSAFWLWTVEGPKKHLSQYGLRFPTNSPWKQSSGCITSP